MTVKNKLEEEHFTFMDYNSSLERVEKYLDGAMAFINHLPGSNKPSGGEEVYGMPNCFLVLKRYGLLSQKEIITLRLENAKLNKEPKEKIAELEYSLNEINKELKTIPDVLYSMG